MALTDLEPWEVKLHERLQNGLRKEPIEPFTWERHSLGCANYIDSTRRSYDEQTKREHTIIEIAVALAFVVGAFCIAALWGH